MRGSRGGVEGVNMAPDCPPESNVSTENNIAVRIFEVEKTASV